MQTCKVWAQLLMWLWKEWFFLIIYIIVVLKIIGRCISQRKFCHFLQYMWGYVMHVNFKQCCRLRVVVLQWAPYSQYQYRTRGQYVLGFVLYSLFCDPITKSRHEYLVVCVQGSSNWDCFFVSMRLRCVYCNKYSWMVSKLWFHNLDIHRYSLFVVCSREKIIFISKRNGANEDVKEEWLCIVGPTLITRMHSKGQHFSLHALVCNTPTFLIRSCMLFSLQCVDWKEIHICNCCHWLVVGIESCMYAIVFSLESWIMYFDMSLHVPRICNGCIKDSRHCRRYFVSDLFYVNLIHPHSEMGMHRASRL